MVYIYSLVDPNNLDVKYIGRSKNVKARFSGHISGKDNTRKTAWIDNLLREGKEPVLKVLESCDQSIAAEREQFYIDLFKNNGCALYNVSNPKFGYIRLHCFMEEELILLLRSNMKKYGCNTIGQFIRLIILKFFE